MTSRIAWVDRHCRLLAQIRREFTATRPFDGMTIGTGIHLEPKTVGLLLTLRAGGASVVATGNLNSTQDDSVAALREGGVTVVGGRTTDSAQHDGWLVEVLDHKPALLLDNGGDLFVQWLGRPYDGLLGGTEETTSGRRRLRAVREKIARPVLVINDSPIKQFAENRHAVGQSVFESFMRITNRATNGLRVTVCGYGGCGKGVAENFRNAFAIVSVLEVDPVRRLEAAFDGFLVPDRADALADADLIVTVTGADGVIGVDDLDILPDGVILANAGHFPREIAVEGIRADPRVVEAERGSEGITTLTLSDHRHLHLLGDGHMVNLAGPRPLGNSIESMDLGFSLQARCLEAIARGTVPADEVVVPVPRWIDEQVASAYLALTRSR